MEEPAFVLDTIKDEVPAQDRVGELKIDVFRIYQFPYFRTPETILMWCSCIRMCEDRDCPCNAFSSEYKGSPVSGSYEFKNPDNKR